MNTKLYKDYYYLFEEDERAMAELIDTEEWDEDEFARLYTLENFYLDDEGVVKFVISEVDGNQSFKYQRDLEGLREKKWWDFDIERLLNKEGYFPFVKKKLKDKDFREQFGIHYSGDDVVEQVVLDFLTQKICGYHD